MIINGNKFLEGLGILLVIGTAFVLGEIVEKEILYKKESKNN